MTTLSKTIGTGVAAALMLATITTGARGFVGGGPAGGGSVGGATRAEVRIKGNVVCADCSLEEAREAQRRGSNLNQLTHRQGQMVMEVSWVNNSQGMRRFTWPPRIWVRAEDSVFEKLSAEENLFKEVKITGLLSNTRTLDIFEVTIPG